MRSSDRYSATARWLHWITVVLVIVLIVTGKNGIEADESGSQTFFWHSSLGVVVMLVAMVRIAWMLVSPSPALPASLSKANRVLARSSHVALYVLLFTLPITGWLAASADGATVRVFGTVSLPRWELPLGGATVVKLQQATRSSETEGNEGTGKTESEESRSLMAELHETLSNVLLVLATLHVLGALAHQFYWPDGILERMLPRRLGAGQQ